MSKDILVTMREDAGRALGKPAKERRWAMLIDLRKCVGCHGCTVACMSENKLPPGVVYRPVKEFQRGTYPNPRRIFVPRPCMQCDEPPCVAECPKPGKGGATWKETEGVGAGLVMIDYQQCIGCGACVGACPYEARTLDEGEFYTAKSPEPQKYECMTSFEYGMPSKRTKDSPPIEKARKCHFCVHRLQNGMLPECVTTCVGRATYFGDVNDPESEISKVIKVNKVQTLKSKKGTKPRVYYISDENLEVIYA
jgi:molybdopterin-containing oxidoreductase family iron-sulfur binding subunit